MLTESPIVRAPFRSPNLRHIKQVWGLVRPLGLEERIAGVLVARVEIAAPGQPCEQLFQHLTLHEISRWIAPEVIQLVGVPGEIVKFPVRLARLEAFCQSSGENTGFMD